MALAELSRSLYNYTFMKKIGKGSYGEVWLSTYTDSKKYVIKKIKIRHAPSKELQAARQECKLLARLNHPNIVTFKDSFEDDGYLYIVMGYCENGDLYHRLKDQRGEPMEERQIGEWLVQITMGLQYLHQRNILHRDLKTQNIFLTRSHLVKLGDFGISRVLNSSEDLATTVIGTPYYMSPELYSSQPYNHKSDIWALGCCTFEMASLKHAFNAQNFTSLSYKILTGKAPDIPNYYSTELNSLTRQMLHQDPSKRPSVSQILKNSYIRNHIKAFLKVTETKSRQQNRSSAGSQGQPLNSRSQSGQRDKISSPSPPREEFVAKKINSNDNVDSRQQQNWRNEQISPSSRRLIREDADDDEPRVKGNIQRNIQSPVNDVPAKQPVKVTELERAVFETMHFYPPHISDEKSDAHIAPHSSYPPDDIKSHEMHSPSHRGDHSPDYPQNNSKSSSSSRQEEAELSSQEEQQQQPSRQDRLHSNARARRRALRQLGKAEKDRGSEPTNVIVSRDEPAVDVIRRRPRPSLSSPVPLPQLLRPPSSRSNSAITVKPLKTPSSMETPIVSPEMDVSEIKEFIQEMNATLQANKAMPQVHPKSAGGPDVDSETERGPTEQAAETVSRTARFNRNMIQLRKECLQVLGHKRIYEAFRALDDIEEEHEPHLRRILADYFDSYVGKIYQLKLYEENCFK